MTRAEPPATIVMYHFVRPRSGTPFPRLAAMDVAAFRGQLEYIGRHYTVVRLADIVAAAGGATLPERPIVLTFDDGYADHYRHVFPLLRAAGVSGAFFPAARSFVDRRMLDVNRIQFVLAAASGPEPLIAAIEDAVRNDEGGGGIERYRQEAWTPTRFDGADVAYVKRMLQRLLPERIRTPLIDELFRDLISRDECGFAGELYFTPDQAREMLAAGMELGCHGDQHLVLTSLSREAQAKEIDGALRTLDAAGVSRARFAYCYAKGEHDADSVELLSARGCAIALTTRVGLAAVTAESMLTMPRLDANDLPADGDAPPNDWLLRSGNAASEHRSIR